MSAISNFVIDKRIHPCYEVVVEDDLGFHRCYKVRIAALIHFIKQTLPFGSVTIIGKSTGTFNGFSTFYEVLPF
nr:hypothetical protein [Prevotella sp.]